MNAGTTDAEGSRGWSDGNRGQTLQDYTVGISVFVITLSIVMVGIFSFIGPTSPGVGSEDVAQTERISTTMIQNLSTGQEPNELRADRLQSTLDRPLAQLRSRWGIESSTNLNVSVETLNGSRFVERGGTNLTAGSPFEGQSTGTTTRIVTLDDESCEPSCRLVVRVW